MDPHSEIELRMRRAQRADRGVLRSLSPNGTTTLEVAPPGVEPPSWGMVFEREGRIVAWERHALMEIDLEDWAPEPIPFAAIPWTDGGRAALVGFGLVLAEPLRDHIVGRIHRLARTLAADEHGARFTVSRVPLPKLEPYDTAGVCQQIAAGAVDWSQMTIPLADGYWPLRVGADDTVWMVREATWA